jgi:hypothetical protein
MTFLVLADIVAALVVFSASENPPAQAGTPHEEVFLGLFFNTNTSCFRSIMRSEFRGHNNSKLIV